MAPQHDPGDDLERGRPESHESDGSVSQCTTVVTDEVSPPVATDDAQAPDAAESPHEKQGQTQPTDDKVQLQDQSNLLPRRQLITVFLCLSAGIFLSVLDQSLVATALPSITQEFNAGSTSTWVATAYLLTGCAVQPLYGRFSDIFGRSVIQLPAHSGAAHSLTGK